MLGIQDEAFFEIQSHPDSYRECIDKKLIPIAIGIVFQ